MKENLFPFDEIPGNLLYHKLLENRSESLSGKKEVALIERQFETVALFKSISIAFRTKRQMESSSVETDTFEKSCYIKLSCNKKSILLPNLFVYIIMKKTQKNEIRTLIRLLLYVWQFEDLCCRRQYQLVQPLGDLGKRQKCPP